MDLVALNNYPLGKMWRLADAGSMPRQHAWGVDRLAALGHGVRLAPFREPYELGLLGRLIVLTRRKLGDIDQELFALGTEADVVFSANEGSARGLALVRSLIGRPVVSILHHPVRPSKTTMRILSHHDAVACLSDRLRAEALELGVAPEKAASVPWGPDLSSPLYRSTHANGGLVVSTGKSNRDLATLRRALAETGQPARVYDLEGRVRASLVFSLAQTREYESTATVLISRQDIASSVTEADNPLTSGDSERLLQTQDALAESTAVGRRVLEAEGAATRTPGRSSGGRTSSPTPTRTCSPSTFATPTRRKPNERPPSSPRSRGVPARARRSGGHPRPQGGREAARGSARHGQGDQNKGLISELEARDNELRTLEALQASNVFVVGEAEEASKVQP